MTKLKIAVIEAMEGRGSLPASEITTLCRYPAPSVRSILKVLCDEGIVRRDKDPTRTSGVLYTLVGVQCGFGVSANMARFDELVRSVRP